MTDNAERSPTPPPVPDRCPTCGHQRSPFQHPDDLARDLGEDAARTHYREGQA